MTDQEEADEAEGMGPVDTFQLKCLLVRQVLDYVLKYPQHYRGDSFGSFSQELATEGPGKRPIKSPSLGEDWQKTRTWQNLPLGGASEVFDLLSPYHRHSSNVTAKRQENAERLAQIKRVARQCLLDPRADCEVYCTIAFQLLQLKAAMNRRLRNSKLCAELEQYIKSRLNNKTYILYLTQENLFLKSKRKELHELIRRNESDMARLIH